MFYGSQIAYDQSNYSYTGTLYIYVPGNSNPIIVPNVSLFYATTEDYSNLTTISLISLEIQGEAIITVVPENEDYTALLTAEVLYLTGENEIAIG
jgi:hypothetical protein